MAKYDQIRIAAACFSFALVGAYVAWPHLRWPGSYAAPSTPSTDGQAGGVVWNERNDRFDYRNYSGFAVVLPSSKGGLWISPFQNLHFGPPPASSGVRSVVTVPIRSTEAASTIVGPGQIRYPFFDPALQVSDTRLDGIPTTLPAAEFTRWQIGPNAGH